MKHILKHIGIGQRTLLIFAVPMLLVVLALGYRITTGYMRDARAALDTRGAYMARQLAAMCEFGLYAHDRDELRKQTLSVLHEKDVVAVQVSDITGMMVVRSGDEDKSGADGQVATYSAPVMRTGVNISDFEPEADTEPGGGTGREAVIGYATVSLSTVVLTDNIERTLLSGSILTVAGLLASILLAYFVARSVSGPIRHLTAVVGKLTGGDLSARCRQGSPGELGSLESGINQMADTLQNARNKLVSEVETATAELQRTVTELETKNIELDHARDEAVRAAAAKSDFLARMSHEIRTPLSAIIGFNELLSKTHLSENQQEYIRTIHQAASQLLQVIEDILGYTRLGSGTLKLERTTFNLHDCLENVISIHTASAHKKRLELVLYIHSDVPRFITSDQNRISQVLTNLTANAIKFTDQGHVVIETSRHELAPGTVTVKIAVSDSGIGLHDSQLEQIFDPFVQADVSISRRFGGTGLGLSISKKLVEQLGGEIEVSNNPGGGSTFSFTIPSPRVDADNIPPLNVLAGKTVLICDGNPFSLRALRNRFFTWGATVFNTPDPARLQQMLADRAADGSPCDLLVMGFNRDDFGRRSCSELCRDYGSDATIPKLFLVSAELGMQAFENSCPVDCRILSKPARSDLLLRTAISLLKLPETPDTVTPDAPLTATARIATSDRLIGLDVLLVEDNRFNQELIGRLLGNLGVNATIACNGSTACALAGRHRYDFIIMDIHMPVMGGIEAVHHIRQGINRQTPIITLTADVFTSEQYDLLQAGFDDCLYKPVSEQDLKDMLQRWRRPGARARIPEADTGRAPGDRKLPPGFHRRLNQELRSRLQALRKACDCGDEAATADELHQLKGVVDYFKPAAFHTLFSDLQAAIHSGDAAAMGPVFDRIESLLAQQSSE